MWDVEGFKLFTKSGKAQPFKSLKVNTDRGEMLVGLNHVTTFLDRAGFNCQTSQTH